MTGTQARLTVAAAVATLLATLTLVPLLQGGGWFVAVVVVIGVVAGVGAAARQAVRWWPAVVLLQTLGLVLCITWLFARDVAAWGLLPGPDVVRELSDLLQAGFTVTRQEVPPVPAIRGVILITCGGVGLVALFVDLIAASLRRPAIAGLPLLAVYCVPAAVLPGGLSWWYFAVAALGFLLLVGSDSVDRIRSWGRVLGPSTDDRGDRALGGPLAGARRLAVSSVLVAAVVPAFVPGLSDQLLQLHGGGHGNGKGGSITVINPILTLKDDLAARTNVTVVRYTTTAPHPDPLRIVSDDVFDGSQWSPSTGEIPRDNKVQDGLSSPPGLSQDVPVRQLRSSITVLDLQQTYLPAPYPATKVDINGAWIYDSRTLNIVGDGVTTRNTRYVVDHLAVEPTAEQLQAAAPPPVQVLSTYGKLPATLPRRIAETARAVAGKGSAYSKALALQEWFRSTGGFVYSEQVDPPKGKQASGQDAVLAFLQNKRGYCVQFASAMAVMARTLNIPSRVAVGFLPGHERADHTYEISVKDAHAWPELYFGGIGWVRFEPTPSTRSGAPPAWAQPATPEAPTPTTTVTRTVAPSSSRAFTRRDPRPDATPVATEPPLLNRIMASIPWRWLAVLAGLATLGGVPLAVEFLVRRTRWRRATRGTVAVRVEAAWDELREELADLGVTWAAAWTPRALQLRLIADHALPGSAQAALGRLVTDLEHARYAPPDGEVRDVAALRSDVATVVRAVAGSARISPWVRRRARWLPTSGLRALGGAVRRLNVAVDEAGRKVSELGADVRQRVGRP
jgi:transglutaminase-like putative cysteine protease